MRVSSRSDLGSARGSTKPSARCAGASRITGRLLLRTTFPSPSAGSSSVRCTARGQKIAYVVDAAYHDQNIDRMVALARGADQFFIEAPFLDTDAEVAAERRHLTARQAGDIAKRAGVSRFVPFHFSARYRDQEDKLRSEVEQAFRTESCSDRLLMPQTAQHPAVPTCYDRHLGRSPCPARGGGSL